MLSIEKNSISEEATELSSWQNILLALDSSDHANRGTQEAIELSHLCEAQITGAHVYAAKLHDLRFRQMEGGLPEQFRMEGELERQRDIHDSLIDRGLSIITDSYLDQAQSACDEHEIELQRCSLEGKNYRELAKEANSGRHDLLIMGAQGLGAVEASSLGTVCERVSRRSDIDTLVIKQADQTLANGPIVVALDGSPKSWGGLIRGLKLAKAWQTPLIAISAFDPYYHYVAFNRIAGVLSEEAGKVFRFKDQEQLHEEIIDSGLAKIYAGHLSIAAEIAADHGIKLETQLLDGKPWDVILKFLEQHQASLLILGKTGIHADEALDIGGNTENLLRQASCSVLMSQSEFRPDLERVAAVNTSWTEEAEQRMTRVPEFVQNMARGAILRYAQERGHTVITARLVEEATQSLMPRGASSAMQDIVDNYEMQWTDQAQALLDNIAETNLRSNLARRAEKKARSQGSQQVDAEHIAAFIEQAPTPHWQAAALARLAKVPQGKMRESCKASIEALAAERKAREVTLELTEDGITIARDAMQAELSSRKSKIDKSGEESICPFARRAAERRNQP